MDTSLRCLGTRYWSLVTAAVDAPDFVTCDHPVTPIFKDPNRRGPIGYGLPGTEVSFPLNARQALLGVCENPLAVSIEANACRVHRNAIHKSTSSWWVARKFLDSMEPGWP